MQQNRREFGLLAAGALLTLPAFADSYPSKPVTILVHQAPGGTNDVVGRILAQKLTELAGSSFIVENRAGANGNIGTDFAARAPKDGYTLLLTVSSTQAINPALYKKVGFDPVQDFEPVAPVGVVPNVLVVNPSVPAKTLEEFLKLARTSKPELQYASAGNGSLNHLLGAMLSNKSGVPLQHVPYRGVAPALTDVMGGAGAGGLRQPAVMHPVHQGWQAARARCQLCQALAGTAGCCRHQRSGARLRRRIVGRTLCRAGRAEGSHGTRGGTRGSGRGVA